MDGTRERERERFSSRQQVKHSQAAGITGTMAPRNTRPHKWAYNMSGATGGQDWKDVRNENERREETHGRNARQVNEAAIRETDNSHWYLREGREIFNSMHSLSLSLCL